MCPKLGHTRLISLVSKACGQHRVRTPLLVLALKSHKKYNLVFISGSYSVIRPSAEKKSKKASRRAYLNKIVKHIIIIIAINSKNNNARHTNKKKVVLNNAINLRNYFNPDCNPDPDRNPDPDYDPDLGRDFEFSP